jgi:UDP-2,3-diacylglucosamine pyrophosphatase LpxH
VDRIVIHGDALHLNKDPLPAVLDTNDWRLLDSVAGSIPVEIIPGNHDFGLEKLVGQALGNCRVISPYLDAWGSWHSHWHEYDPIFGLSRWWYQHLAHFFKKTPYQLLQPKAGNPIYLSACQVIHTNIINRRRHKSYIGGHTHLPMRMDMPDLGLELWNCGDLVDSNSGIVRKGVQLEQIFFGR